MLDFLRGIWDGIRSVPFLVADFLVDAFNLIIVGIGGLLGLVVALLPPFPDPPDPPAGGILGVMSWVAPVGAMVAGFALLVSMWVGFMLIKIALRWVKAL